MDTDAKIKMAKLRCLEMCTEAGVGHLTSALSCAEIVGVLYYEVMRIDPKNPKWEGRDRFVMSKNHASVILYPILEDLGFLEKGTCHLFLQNGSMVGPHTKLGISGSDFCGGSLGIGLGAACGMAYAACLRQSDYLTFCLVGDGECYEGSIWETVMFAGAHKLSNLVAIVDRNQMCITDFTERMLPMEPLGGKWDSFGWEVREVNGHNIGELRSVLSDIRSRKGRPLCIVANTVKGNGVDFLAGKQLWHGRAPSAADAARARKQLEGAD